MPSSHPREQIAERPEERPEESPAARMARESLVREIREGIIGPDIAAADEVKYLGLIADDD